MMIGYVDCLWSGLNHFIQAHCQTFRSCAGFLFACTLWLHLSSIVSAQYQPRVTSANVPTNAALQELKPVKPKKPSRHAQQPQTRSILQPASHSELIIPSATEFEVGGHEVIDEGVGHEQICSSDCDGHSNAYDFITDQRAVRSGSYFLDWTRVDLWAGTTAFTNPANSFTNGAATVGQAEGAFGFQQGFNFGSQMPSLLSGQLGAQLGMRFVQSNLNGSEDFDGSRNQMFATGGLFRRVDYGFQGGAVFDFVRDQWIYKGDLWQLRSELSFLFSPAHELGFRFTDGGSTHRQRIRLASGTDVNVVLEPMDTYRLFGRLRFGNCAANLAEVQLGTSRDGGLLLGTLLQNPLSGQVGLETAATYFIPQASVSNADTREAWNLSLSLVWTPGRSFGTRRDYYRPLFEVAGNSSFIASRP
jgi:hypothetical protein